MVFISPTPRKRRCSVAWLPATSSWATTLTSSWGPGTRQSWAMDDQGRPGCGGRCREGWRQDGGCVTCDRADHPGAGSDPGAEEGQLRKIEVRDYEAQQQGSVSLQISPLIWCWCPVSVQSPARQILSIHRSLVGPSSPAPGTFTGVDRHSRKNYMVPTWLRKRKRGYRLMRCNPLIFLVPKRGIEPPTFSLRMSCSTD